MSQLISDRKRGFFHLCRGVLQVCDRGELTILAAPLVLLAISGTELHFRASSLLQGATALAFIVSFFTALLTLGSLERRYEAREMSRDRAAALALLPEAEHLAYLRDEQSRGPSAGTQDAIIPVSDTQQ